MALILIFLVVFSYLSSHWAGIIDYIAISTTLLYHVDCFRADNNVESDHCPLRLLLNFKQEIYLSALLDGVFSGVRKIKWSDQLFINLAQTLTNIILLFQHQALLQPGSDTIKLFDEIVSSIKPVISNNRPIKSKKSPGSGWFDQECKKAKKELNKYTFLTYHKDEVLITQYTF